MPSVAKAKSKAGLEAFARHWLAARSYLVKTGDPSALLGLSTSACDCCTGIAKVFADTYRAGGHYSGGLDAAVMAVMLSGLSGASSGYIQFRAEIPAYTKIARAGASPEYKRSAVLDYTLNADYRSGRWVVRKASWHTVQEES
jgi:hypothetical protein